MNKIVYSVMFMYMLILTCNTNSQTERWKYVYTLNDKLEYYYDVSSVTYEENRLTVWVKWIYLFEDGYNTKETVTLFEFDCYYRKYTFLYQIMYFRDATKTETDLSKTDYYEILKPGDEFEPYFNLLCK